MPLMMQSSGEVLTAPSGVASRARRPGSPATRLDVGLVNNMPDGALDATERQFARVLAQASGEVDVRLHLFALAEIPRAAPVRAAMAGRYGDLAALERSRLDGLIVTGAEPLAARLTDEPYWGALARVIDWAEGNTASALWSCLAAHAAVLHLDGIARRRLPRKRSGLYECVAVAAGGLFEGAPAGMRVPHSRWNDLAEGDLRAHGYGIATRSLEAGIDCFTKQWGSLFVFLQGHPEYDVDTLYREFRRDMRRFVDGQRPDCPQIPATYFDAATEDRLNAFCEAARRDPGGTRAEAFPEVWSIRPAQSRAWQATSRHLFGNWLGLLAEAARA